MNTRSALRRGLLALSCAACLFTSTTQAQLVSTPPSSGGGGFSPVPGGGTGGISIGDLLGTPPASGGGSSIGGASSGGGGGMCSAPLGGATCGGAGPASQGNTSGVNTGAGNPINLTNGNKFQTEVDLPALPGELGLEIVRHYNSTHRYVLGQLGVGWRLSYETDLYVIGRTVQILQADGARLVFNIDPRNPSLCAGADPAQGWVQILTRDSGKKEYLWHWTHGEHAGRRLRFDERGKLVQIIAASGALLSIEHGPKGQLLKVTDPQGRTLSFNHGGLAHARQVEAAQQQKRQASGADPLAGSAGAIAVFTGIQSIDSPLGRFTYEQGVPTSTSTSTSTGASTPESAALARAQAANLVQVSLPTHVDHRQSAHPFANRPASSSTLRRQYHYEDPRHPQALTGISVVGTGSDGQVMQQRLATYQYNERAQATLSVRGEADSATERVQVQILKPSLQSHRTGNGNEGAHSGNPIGQTLLTNSLGQQTLYTHQIIDGQYRLLQAVGAGCSQCGPVNLRWGYDARGRLIEQTALSPVAVINGQPQGTPQPLLTTRHTLDAQGRTERIEQIAHVNGKAQAPRLVERHEHTDARWPTRPTLIARASVVPGQEHRMALTYNEAGQVVALTEAGHSPLDAQGQLARTPVQATRLERSTRYTYSRINGRSLLTRVDGPLPNGPSGSAADSDITELEWDERGRRVLAVTHPMGLKETFGYDMEGDNPTGRLVSRWGVHGVQTTLRWDHHHRVTQVQSAGVSVSLVHDALGRVVRYERNDGAVITAAYDPSRRRVAYTLPDGEVQYREFDNEQRMSRVGWHAASGPDAALVAPAQIEYDAALNRPMRWTEPSGLTTRWTYDPQGRLATQQRGALTTQQRFDPTEHLLELQRNEAVTQLRQGSGDQGAGPEQAQQSLTLPNGATHRQWTDDFGRVVRLQHPETGTHRAAYDEADRQTARWDSHRHSSARYDALGRLIHLRHAHTDGARIQSASAVVKAVVQTDEETHWQYAGALLMRQTSKQQDQQWRYDTHARVIEERLSLRRQAATHENGADPWLAALITRYERDTFGRIQRTVLPEGAVLTQRYNTQGRIDALALQEPATRWWHTAVRWVWAEHGTRDLITGIQHSSSRGLQSYQHANGSTASSAHDQAARLTQWADGPNRTVLGFNQQAQLGSIKAQAPERPGPTMADLVLRQREHELSYDPFGRLRQVSQGQTVQQSFELDANGNRTAQSSDPLGPLSFTLAANSDRLLGIQNQQGQAQQSYQYNSAGEPTRIDGPAGHRTLHHNAIGQIGAVEHNGQLLAHYAYNGARQRVAKTVERAGQPHTTYFTWHAGLLDAELDSQGHVKRRTIYLHLRPVALIDYGYAPGDASAAPHSTQRFAIHGDHLGTPQAITDEQQRVVWLAQYDAFGRASTQGLPRSEVTAQHRSPHRSWVGSAHAAGARAAASEPFEFNLRFAGQYEDTETGWHYNWHRFYDPDTGRYLTPDPIGLRGGDNAFAYAGGDPLGAVDPWGLRAIVVGNTIQIRPEDLSVPAVDIPNTVGASGFTSNHINFHYYDVTAATRLGACQVGQSLRNNPTPGNDSPASINGTRNNAGLIPLHGANNFVRSFYIPSPNPTVWTDITVNYTIAGEHGLHEDYVLRYGQIGSNGTVNIRSYGEGQDAAQNMLLQPIWGSEVEEVWQSNYREIERNPSSCGCR
jgi:RHS repeat-associated protein